MTGAADNAVLGKGRANLILSYPGADKRALPAIVVTQKDVYTDTGS